MHLIFGITTYNRLSYLTNLINTWDKTRNKEHQWTLIICDDGFTDGSKQFIENLSVSNAEVVRIFNNRNGVGFQTNKILEHSNRTKFDVGFKSDDDLFFIKPGWDDLYINSIKRSRYQHLSFFDAEWANKYWNKNTLRQPLIIPDKLIQCKVSGLFSSMGAFWTFTPSILKMIGYIDVVNLGIYGCEHIDYSARCCRLRFNKAETFFDALDSEKYIKLVEEQYVAAISQSEKDIAASVDPSPHHKWEAIGNRKRTYIPLRQPKFNMKGERNENFIQIPDQIQTPKIQRNPGQVHKPPQRQTQLRMEDIRRQRRSAHDKRFHAKPPKKHPKP